MKWIKNRASYLKEAKIRDVILDPQKKEVAEFWGEKFLDFEKVDPTDKIIQGKWKLSEEDKIKALSIFFSADLNRVYDFFGSLPDEFVKIIKDSIDFNLLKEEKWIKILNEFDLKKPTINQISALSESIFRKVTMSESKSDEIMIRDESGRPVMGEDGRPMKRRREEGEVIFSKNLVNINGMTEDFNSLYPDKKVDAFKFSSGEVLKVISASKEDFGSDNYLVDVDVYGKDLHLRIDHNPKDILNMSISRFYGSCQHLYRGGYRKQLLANVFDPNSIPAFLVFDSPIIDKNGVMISEQLPLSRMMIRNIYSFDTTADPKIFFDRSYPDRMELFFNQMVEKYSGNSKTADPGEAYIFAPDLPQDVDIEKPYMDRLSIRKKRMIGVNSKSISFGVADDWSDLIISPKAQIEEINIETTLLPDNFFQINLRPKWIRLRYINIRDMNVFSKIKSESWAFEKCKMKSQIFEEFIKIHSEIKSLQFVSCNISKFNFSALTKLEELELIFLDGFEFDDLQQLVTTINPKRGFKLTITSDLFSSKTEKEYINGLKGRGIIVKVYEEEIAKKRRESRKK
jgi:hypothetical protein